MDAKSRDTAKQTQAGSLRPALDTMAIEARAPSALLRLGVLALAFERGAENVAQRCARIGRAVLGDRLLLLGHLQRLDRQRDLARLAVELGDAGVDLLTDLEAVGALVVTVAGEL